MQGVMNLKYRLDLNFDRELLILLPDPAMDMDIHIHTELTQVISKKSI